MTDQPIAKTSSGPVRGFVEDGINVFKGVRYGADTATTRFAAPQKPAAWTETRDALAYGLHPASDPQADDVAEECAATGQHGPRSGRGGLSGCLRGNHGRRRGLH